MPNTTTPAAKLHAPKTSAYDEAISRSRLPYNFDDWLREQVAYFRAYLLDRGYDWAPVGYLGPKDVGGYGWVAMGHTGPRGPLGREAGEFFEHLQRVGYNPPFGGDLDRFFYRAVQCSHSVRINDPGAMWMWLQAGECDGDLVAVYFTILLMLAYREFCEVSNQAPPRLDGLLGFVAALQVQSWDLDAFGYGYGKLALLEDPEFVAEFSKSRLYASKPQESPKEADAP